MARTVSVGEFQQQQRGGTPSPGFQSPARSVAEQLQVLVLEDDIAGMPLGQVDGLLRRAVEAAHVNATAAEIRAEAERRWLDGKLDETPERCPHGHDGCDGRHDLADDPVEPKPEDRPAPADLVADVNPDGTVAEVRPAEMTPDRGEGVGETHHTVTDDEPRFSGGGANDIGAELYAVPTDVEFRGKLYRDAPDLANIAEALIERHGFLSDLMNAEIRYYWRRKTGVSKGRVKIGYCKRASDLLGHFSGADFIIWLSATTARDGKFTPKQVEAAVFHQLCHIETDDEGNFISARHDFEGFAAEIRHYGTWTEDLKLVVPAVDAARQMGLFDVDDEGIEDDDEGEEPSAEYTTRVDWPDTSGELPTGDEIDAARAAFGFAASNEGQEEDILLDDPAVI